MEQIIERPAVAGPAAIFEISGTVKWYNSSKGYGFIVSEGHPDIFLGQTVVDLCGLGVPTDGCAVRVSVTQRGKGLACREILEMARPVSEIMRMPRVTDADVRDVTGPTEGKVKLFKGDAGYGFITVGAATRDIFVHAKTLEKAGIVDLSEGDLVDVTWGTGPKGLTAVEVRRRARMAMAG